VGDASSNERLGYVASIVGRRSVHFGGVFAGEGTTAVRSPSTIRVNDDFATSETGIGGRTPNIELARRIDHNLCILEHVFRDDLLDDLFGEYFTDGFVGDFRVVLS